MPIADALALLGLAAGALLFLVASVGLVRFPDVLTRMHAASKPQTLGLMLVMIGLALALRSVAGVCLAVLVLLAQTATAPVASTLLARAAFRRGFVRGGTYEIDELTPRLAHGADQDDDEDGFLDETVPGAGDEELAADAARLPRNTVGTAHAAADRSQIANWEDREPELAPDVDGMDIEGELGPDQPR